ncbi:MAG: Methyl-accepting chemotaxis protein 4 [Candidatus Accumulibacter appositus]|uniref:Methyl-accepting chemotaxis protein 4 n=2 Tax=Candidatus Accumulibacter TaxID=327159 RepID=A0A011PWD2_9PROT|nr:MAG: Methyl-accepting chemotaxis protein 4 [Candidatus Accumulibacter appositus]
MKVGKRIAWIAVLVACGLGRVAMAAETATPEEVISKVRAAASFLHNKGTSGYADFNNRDSNWVWKDSYVFVYDCRQDRMIAHPMRPDLVGKPIMQITDNSGKYIFKELCKAGNQAHGGWVEYAWSKPGAGALSRKISYALAADISFASGIQVSAGVYDELMTIPQLDAVLKKMSDPSRYQAL